MRYHTFILLGLFVWTYNYKLFLIKKPSSVLAIIVVLSLLAFLPTKIVVHGILFSSFLIFPLSFFNYPTFALKSMTYCRLWEHHLSSLIVLCIVYMLHPMYITIYIMRISSSLSNSIGFERYSSKPSAMSSSRTP